jgi:SAM-dependent methyltransferase
MDILTIHQETGAFWNEIADTYGDESQATEFLKSGGNYLFESEQQILGDISTWCKCAIHLQCSHGNDTLSLLRQGAANVVGVDISTRLLAIAGRKTQALGASATWHCSDILQAPDVLNRTANLVYTGKGALCWMMDIAAWANVAARLLAPHGRLFVYEAHPLDWVWDIDAPGYALDVEHGSYFSERFRESLFSRVTQAIPRSRQWTLGQIVNSIIGAGLTIEQLHEYPIPFWNQFPKIPTDTLHRLPHTFALLARKP